MKTRSIGDVKVSAIGLGAMPMSLEGRPDEAQAIATIHAALDAGITLIDTADAYHEFENDVGHNELLVAKAVRKYAGDTSTVLVATKGGLLWPTAGSHHRNGRPAYLKQACRASLTRLGVEAIGLYQLHRHDPRTPYADSIGALRELYDDGLIRAVGISNVDGDQIQIAHDILGDRLVSVQNELSPAARGGLAQLARSVELGLAYLTWSPLGGIGAAKSLGTAHPAFATVATRHGVSPQRVCLAWHLAQSERIVPIVGASRPQTIADSAAAADLALSAEELKLLDEDERRANVALS